jgi:hypothetical protein
VWNFSFSVLWNKILLNKLLTELQVLSATVRFPFNALELINVKSLLNKCNFIWVVGPGSSVDIATELPGWTVRGSNPVMARFSAAVQTGPGAHPVQWVPGVSRG